jgi:hypothetical protein
MAKLSRLTTLTGAENTRQIHPGHGDVWSFRYFEIVWDGAHYRVFQIAYDWTRYLVYDGAHDGVTTPVVNRDALVKEEVKVLTVDGALIQALIRDGHLCIEIDTFQADGAAFHDADGTPRVKIHVNDGRVWPPVECTCRESLSLDHSAACAVSQA